MESVDRTSSVIPLTVSFHSDRWGMSWKNRPSGSSGLASMSPLGLETRKVEPSRMLMLLSLIERLSVHATGNRAPLAPLPVLASNCRIAWRGNQRFGRCRTSEGWPFHEDICGSPCTHPAGILISGRPISVSFNYADNRRYCYREHQCRD